MKTIWSHKKTTYNHGKLTLNYEDQPGTMKYPQNPPGTIKNQPGTLKKKYKKQTWFQTKL